MLAIAASNFSSNKSASLNSAGVFETCLSITSSSSILKKNRHLSKGGIFWPNYIAQILGAGDTLRANEASYPSSRAKRGIQVSEASNVFFYINFFFELWADCGSADPKWCRFVLDMCQIGWRDVVSWNRWELDKLEKKNVCGKISRQDLSWFRP